MDGQDETNTGSHVERQSEQSLATQLERLDDVLNMYGALQARWPDSVRAEFTLQELALPAFARRIEEERAFAHLLNMDVTPSPSHSLRASILASAPNTKGAKSVAAPMATEQSASSRISSWLKALWSGGANLIPAGALAASIMGGVILGSTGLVGNFSSTSDPTEEMMTLAFADTQYSGDW
ncbi:MAG: hypothetical protein KUG61_00990 [Parvibaculaceae bacterium]|nr:hypothetical protein [Parvibaculaceae bacterium]